MSAEVATATVALVAPEPEKRSETPSLSELVTPEPVNVKIAAMNEEKVMTTEAPEETTEEVTAPSTAAPSRSGRVKKEVARFEAAEIKVKAEFSVIPGEGIALGEIDWIEEKLQKQKADSEIVQTLYNIVFGRRGKKQNAKQHLRLWSGLPAGLSEDELEEVKDKMYSRIDKHKMSLIKEIMTTLNVPRSSTKEDCANDLFEWLCKPKAAEKKKKATPKKSEKRKPASAKKGPAKKKAKRNVEEEDDEDDDDEDDEDEFVVSMKDMKKWVAAYITCMNIEEVTVSTALNVFESKFGVSIREDPDTKKKFKQLLIAEMTASDD